MAAAQRAVAAAGTEKVECSVEECAVAAARAAGPLAEASVAGPEAMMAAVAAAAAIEALRPAGREAGLAWAAKVVWAAVRRRRSSACGASLRDAVGRASQPNPSRRCALPLVWAKGFGT